MKKPSDYGLPFKTWKEALVSIKDQLSKEDIDELKECGIEL